MREYADSSPKAYKKLDRLLAEHPGFYYDVHGLLAKNYSPKHNLLKPIVPRVNWLNVLSKDAFLFFPGGQEALYEAAKQWPALTMHTLPHGFVVQAGEEPGIGDDGRAPEAYYDANNFLSLFLSMSNDESDYKEWERHFLTPEILEKLKEQAGLLEGHY